MTTPDDDERSPLLGGLRRLFSSSKYLLVLLAIIGIVVMNLVGRISGEMALAAIGGLISVAIGATAVEDAAGKVGGRPMSAKAISALVGGVQAVLASLPAKHEVLVPGQTDAGSLHPEDQYILAVTDFLQQKAIPGRSLLGLTLCDLAGELEAMVPDEGAEGIRGMLGDDLYLIHTRTLDECRANPSHSSRKTFIRGTPRPRRKTDA